MFDADRPITKSIEDKLNRSLFAKYLARCILDHQDLDSLVVGLYGGWGAGKTSVINLVLEELNFAASNLEDNQKPIILNFSAWSYSGQHQLIYSFFRRLSSALRSVNYLENSDRIIHLLELYVSFFTHKPVPKPLRTKRSLWEKITFQGREEIYAWESGRDLTLVKAELNELLKNQQHKIIIIIDNISRLEDEEIRQIFQIVKSMGDYANTTYLLAFDKDQVVKAINDVDGLGGEEFVEKVVQLPFYIPPILQQDLENIFEDRLQEVLKSLPPDTWNVEYWADIYYSSLKYFFHNCRDITRYVNTLNFSYPRLRELVNPVDFFALTTIEVFLPQVYFGIRDNKDLFTDLLDQVYILNHDQSEKEIARCNEILERAHDQVSKDVLLSLLMRLFPRLRRLYQPESAFYYSDTMARKLNRICSPDLFDVYFRLSMQTSTIQHHEFESILSMANDADAFDQVLMRLNQDERITKFIDQLDSKVILDIPRENIKNIICALMNNGDLFPQGHPGLLSLDMPMRIHRIIHALLHRYGKAEDRFLILQQAIAKAENSLYIIVHELREQSKEHSEQEDTFLPLEYRDLMPDHLLSLKQLAASRIQHWADNGSLQDHPRLFPILIAWLEWSDERECKHYVKVITDTDKGLIAFLSASLNQAVGEVMEDYEKSADWQDYLANIALFIEPKTLEEHAKILFEDEYFEKLREKEQLALMIFLDLIKSDTTKFIRKTSA